MFAAKDAFSSRYRRNCHICSTGLGFCHLKFMSLFFSVISILCHLHCSVISIRSHYFHLSSFCHFFLFLSTFFYLVAIFVFLSFSILRLHFSAPHVFFLSFRQFQFNHVISPPIISEAICTVDAHVKNHSAMLP